MREFWQACGGSGPQGLEVECEGPEGLLRQELEYPCALLGRDRKNQIVLAHRDISRRHAYFQLIAGRVFCLDLQSRTGTHWEGGQGPWGWLKPDQEVRVGPFRVRFRHRWGEAPRGGPDAEELPEPVLPWPPTRGPLPAVVLEFLNGRPPSPFWVMQQALALAGTSKRCSVRLLSRNVSRFHSSLLRTAEGVWVIDLHRGTRVNEQPVRFARLGDGDLLQIGKFRMRVRFDTAPADAATRPEPAALPARLPTPARADINSAPRLAPVAPNVPGPALRSPSPLPEEALVVQLVAQLGAVQQQMFEQQNHAMLMQQRMLEQQQQAVFMLIQLLGALHQDQAEQIRGELERLGGITAELRSVHAQLHGESSRSDASGFPGGPPNGETGRGVAPSPRYAGPHPARAARGEERPAGSPPEGPAQESPLRNSSDPAQVHAWLRQRVAALHNEQQTAWGKVLSFLSGRTASPPV
jgi:hypothetical protein